MYKIQYVQMYYNNRLMTMTSDIAKTISECLRRKIRICIVIDIVHNRIWDVTDDTEEAERVVRKLQREEPADAKYCFDVI